MLALEAAVLTVRVLEVDREMVLPLEGKGAFCASKASALAVRELAVRGEVALLFEGFSAFMTLIRTVASVDAAMFLPIRLGVEAFVADTAAVVDLVFVLALSVVLEISPRPIRPIALTAFECFVVSVLLFPMLCAICTAIE